ncbi:MAG: 3-keto-disaccharide hydrolase [Fimbriiglobus sp.]
MRCTLFAVCLGCLPLLLLADDPKATPMFNGKDLSSWVNVNCAPKTFFVKDGMVVTDGKPTGFLRSEKHYENFILEMEWMHTNTKAMGNSGLFVWGDPLPAVGTGYTRGIEVQVLVNFEADWATSHGDVFSIWGAKCKPDRPHPKGIERCLPSERRCKGGGEWNHYKVIANNGAIKLEVNGKEVSGVSECSPRKGYLALESEGAECRFRNVKIQELPSTNPKPEEIAKLDAGHKSLYTGVDMTGWKGDGWKSGEVLTATGEGKLTSEKEFDSGELIFDVQSQTDTVLFTIKNTTLTAKVKPKTWTRITLDLTSSAIVGTAGTEQIVQTTDNNPTPGPLVIHGQDKLQVRNLFFRSGK